MSHSFLVTKGNDSHWNKLMQGNLSTCHSEYGYISTHVILLGSKIHLKFHQHDNTDSAFVKVVTRNTPVLHPTVDIICLSEILRLRPLIWITNVIVTAWQFFTPTIKNTSHTHHNSWVKPRLFTGQSVAAPFPSMSQETYSVFLPGLLHLWLFTSFTSLF